MSREPDVPSRPDQRERADDGSSDRGATDCTSRRGVLATVGAGAIGLVAGCNAAGSSPRYEPGTVGERPEDDTRSAAQLSTAASMAQQEPTQGVAPLDALELRDHRYVVRDDYRGPTVAGTVENVGGDRVERAEVRVRVYDAEDNHLGRFYDSTGDLGAGDAWSFEAIVLASPTDVAQYDVAVVGV